MADETLPIDTMPLGVEPAEIHVPGSIANLGPGFDTLAVAVNLYLSLLVERREGLDGVTFDFVGCAALHLVETLSTLEEIGESEWRRVLGSGLRPSAETRLIL